MVLQVFNPRAGRQRQAELLELQSSQGYLVTGCLTSQTRQNQMYRESWGKHHILHVSAVGILYVSFIEKLESAGKKMINKPRNSQCCHLRFCLSILLPMGELDVKFLYEILFGGHRRIHLGSSAEGLGNAHVLPRVLVDRRWPFGPLQVHGDMQNDKSR